MKLWPSVPHMWNDLSETEGDRIAVIDQHNGEKVTLTFSELTDQIGACTAALRKIGLKRGEKISLISENSYRWLIIDQAVMSVGAATAVRGSNAPLQELSYICKHSESVAIIAETSEVLLKLLKSVDIDKIRFAVVLWGNLPTVDEDIKIYSFESLVRDGWKDRRDIGHPCAESVDLATLVYTSGTTGKPKGVQLTHRNLLYQVTTIDILHLNPTPGDVSVSILPCWHIFERSAEYYLFARGVCTIYSNVRHFRSDLQTHKPTVLIAVPRVYESLYKNIMSTVSKQNRLKRQLVSFFSLVSLYYQRTYRTLFSLDIYRYRSGLWKKFLALVVLVSLFLLHQLSDLVIWSKIRQGLSGRLKCCICGGGSLPFYLEEFYASIGVCILTGYGLTETSPVVCHRRPGKENVLGSSGKCLQGTLAKIVDPETKEPLETGNIGLLLVKGPGVVKEYYKETSKTDVFMKDGFFNTGDLAWIMPKTGHIVLSGRYKDIIVLSNGENVEPEPIESAILESPLFDQVMLVGQDQKHLGALLVPSLEYLKEENFLTSEQVTEIEAIRHDSSQAAILHKIEDQLENKERFKQLVLKELRDRVTSRPNFTTNDMVRTFRIIMTPFTVENGMLTQTLKVKRSRVYEEYKETIESLFQTESSHVYPSAVVGNKFKDTL
eukprot:jgi/Galph1/4826/GphlegSOOS_G3488.1